MQDHLCRILAHYLIILGALLKLPLEGDLEKLILMQAHKRWNKEETFQWSDSMCGSPVSARRVVYEDLRTGSGNAHASEDMHPSYLTLGASDPCSTSRMIDNTNPIILEPKATWVNVAPEGILDSALLDCPPTLPILSLNDNLPLPSSNKFNKQYEFQSEICDRSVICLGSPSDQPKTFPLMPRPVRRSTSFVRKERSQRPKVLGGCWYCKPRHLTPHESKLSHCSKCRKQGSLPWSYLETMTLMLQRPVVLQEQLIKSSCVRVSFDDSLTWSKQSENQDRPALPAASQKKVRQLRSRYTDIFR